MNGYVIVNSFVADVTILYHLKKSENHIWELNKLIRKVFFRPFIRITSHFWLIKNQIILLRFIIIIIPIHLSIL